MGGSLELEGTPIKELPEGLKVGGALNLVRSSIRELPEGLKVDGWLNICGTDIDITTIPESVEVKGNVCLPDGTRINGSELHQYIQQCKQEVGTPGA